MRKDNSRPYRIWMGIKARTTNPNNKDYKNYGGRGIEMDPKWVNSFKQFWEDMKCGYEDNLTIDRIDNNKGYTKENCRWVTNKEQANNRRNNRTFIYKGNRYTMAELADKYGISKHLLFDRLKWGWSLEKALTTKVEKKIYEYKGNKGTLKSITEKYNKDYRVVLDRLRLGWSMEDAMETPKKKRTIKKINN